VSPGLAKVDGWAARGVAPKAEGLTRLLQTLAPKTEEPPRKSNGLTRVIILGTWLIVLVAWLV
jgi:hypothetical protein